MPHDTSVPQGFRVLVIVSRPLDLQDLPNIADQWSLLGGLRRVNAPAFLKILRPPTVEGLRKKKDLFREDLESGGELCKGVT